MLGVTHKINSTISRTGSLYDDSYNTEGIKGRQNKCITIFYRTHLCGTLLHLIRKTFPCTGNLSYHVCKKFQRYIHPL